MSLGGFQLRLQLRLVTSDTTSGPVGTVGRPNTETSTSTVSSAHLFFASRLYLPSLARRAGINSSLATLVAYDT